MTFSYVIIPWDESRPLEEGKLEPLVNENVLTLDDFRRTRARIVVDDDDVLYTPLLLPSSDFNEGIAGCYVYYTPTVYPENMRATRLAIPCGLFSKRFRGTVLLVRAYAQGSTTLWEDVSANDVYGACCISPDLRIRIQAKLGGPRSIPSSIGTPEWLGNAARQNYHDAAIISRLMKNAKEGQEEGEEIENSFIDIKTTTFISPEEQGGACGFVAMSSLCLHCRGPSDQLCPDCEGAYFCVKPRTCRQAGWSHRCLCATWKVYSDRRAELSEFPFHEWHVPLLSRSCQVSEQSCRRFLEEDMGLSLEHSSWWRTEIGGWSGGESDSARTIDVSQRLTYLEGFAPILDVPFEGFMSTSVTDEPLEIERNGCGLLKLDSWEQYYRLRGIALSSPVALLLTFPLTIYYAIVCHGEVPVTVARMLKRPLRIHVVGIEKEMNFLDLFKEVGYLLPHDLEVELVFVVRQDMLPVSCRKNQTSHGYSMKLTLTTNVTLLLVSGTYGDTLDPNFDCGGGAPDMIVGMNAGLFAYESWRSVVEYLCHHTGVVGVFTDYNEHSGMNCASLGGTKARESLSVNPFRQPRAMPVHSMNLPQFSNGFIYIYNQQELE